MFDQAEQRAISESFKGRTLDQQTRSEIYRIFSGLDIHEVQSDMLVTADFRTDRVRIWYDSKTKIIESVSVG